MMTMRRIHEDFVPFIADLESIIVLLSIPVAIVVYGLAAPVRVIGGGVLMIACLLCCRKSEANAGPDRQVELQVPSSRPDLSCLAMFFLGVVFAIMWFCDSGWSTRRRDQGCASSPGVRHVA